MICIVQSDKSLIVIEDVSEETAKSLSTMFKKDVKVRFFDETFLGD